MTNLICVLLITVTTNWSTIGTFTPSSGSPVYDVQQGVLATNHIARICYDGQTIDCTLRVFSGPEVGERKVERPRMTNGLFWATNGVYTNMIVTNWVIPRMPTYDYTNYTIPMIPITTNYIATNYMFQIP